MKDNQVTMTLHLDIAAQKIINMMVINNEEIEGQLKSGIEKAFKEFDFEAVVTAATKGAIEREIKESTNWGKLRDIVRNKANEIVERHIEKEMEKFKKSFK
jgi:hypothetical protein